MGSYCRECFLERYFSCNECDEIISNDGRNEDPEGRDLCIDCYNERWFTCYECQEVVSIDDCVIKTVRYTPHELCSDCAEKAKAE